MKRIHDLSSRHPGAGRDPATFDGCWGTDSKRHWVPAFAGMTVKSLVVAIALASMSFAALAQDVLIRNATVHTAGAQGTLKNADVLVRNGVVQAVGTGLAAPEGQAKRVGLRPGRRDASRTRGNQGRAAQEELASIDTDCHMVSSHEHLPSARLN